MFGIGIDVGSAYTKYCVMNDAWEMRLSFEKTPVCQREYFVQKEILLRKEYPNCRIVSCGYGRENVSSFQKENELIALSKGVGYVCPETQLVLDIGGQDTKLIRLEKGVLKEFFINDKCAAGSGSFLTETLNQMGVKFGEIDLATYSEPRITLSSVCAVFARSELVRYLAEDVPVETLIGAVIWQILKKTEALLDKTQDGKLLLSGGLTGLKGFCEYAQKALKRDCFVDHYSNYFSAIGCALMALGKGV